MVLFSTVYVVATIALHRAGAGDASIVYANIGNLAVRITYYALFAAPQLRLRSVLPPASFVLALGRARPVVALNVRRTGAIAVDGALLDAHVLLQVGVGGVLTGASGWAAGRAPRGGK